VNNSSFIPFNRPSIGEEEIAEVRAVLESGWLTSGPRTAQFEEEFKRYVQAPFALAVNSCTAGLHLALAALQLGPGDEVITTPLTFCATVNTILQVGATPVLADIGPDGNIDPDSIAGHITPRTKAIMPVHVAGLACNMEAIWVLAREYGFFVVEDAAHAVGTYFKDVPVGAASRFGCSDVVVYSFYATKNLTTGEGGMVTTHQEPLLDKMRILCLHGISRDAWNRYSESGSWRYDVIDCGFKYNLSDLQSAIGIHQLRRQEQFIQRRTEYVRIYNEAFEGIQELEIPPDSRDGRNSWHLYSLRLNLNQMEIGRGEFIAALRQKGIGASVHFIPIPLLSAYRNLAAKPENHCPRALALYERLVSLPLYPAMTEDEVRYVAATVRTVVREAGRARRIASHSR
jgi:dTDP-4-amino-4,6-dideoxygalactose transaminase